MFLLYFNLFSVEFNSLVQLLKINSITAGHIWEEKLNIVEHSAELTYFDILWCYLPYTIKYLSDISMFTNLFINTIHIPNLSEVHLKSLIRNRSVKVLQPVCNHTFLNFFQMDITEVSLRMQIVFFC